MKAMHQSIYQRYLRKKGDQKASWLASKPTTHFKYASLEWDINRRLRKRDYPVDEEEVGPPYTSPTKPYYNYAESPSKNANHGAFCKP